MLTQANKAIFRLQFMIVRFCRLTFFFFTINFEFLHQQGSDEEVGQQRREDADDCKHAEVDAHGASRGGEAGKDSRSDDGGGDDGHSHNAEGATEGLGIVGFAVELKFRVVEEVDGVVDGHTQHHRYQRGGHHVERDAHPSHESAHEDGRHQVGNETDETHADALESYH